MKTKLKLTLLTLALAISTTAKAQEYSEINDPTFVDEETYALNELQNEQVNQFSGVEPGAYASANAMPEEPQELASTTIVPVAPKVDRFYLSESETSVSEKISDELNEKNITADNLMFKRVNGNKAFTYDQIKNVTLKTKFSIDSIKFDEEKNQFTANLKPQYGAYMIELSGNYSIGQKVPVLARNISKGQQITQEDIELKSFPKEKILSSDISDVNDIIGKTTTKNLTRGMMVAEEDIRSPIVVSKNSTVSAIYRSNNIEVKALAVALDDGGEGDIIRLKNFDSGKNFKAVVQADGTVFIGTNTADIATTTAQANGVNIIK